MSGTEEVAGWFLGQENTTDRGAKRNNSTSGVPWRRGNLNDEDRGAEGCLGDEGLPSSLCLDPNSKGRSQCKQEAAG
jgi:hypothetical protein